MIDILKHLFDQFPYNSKKVKTTLIGEKYVSIMHTDGNIGACATLDQSISQSVEDILCNPDFSNIHHRITVNAWINACGNYEEELTGYADIFEAIDFASHSNMVMIGYFGSLAQKFIDKNINITIFDLNPEDKPVAPMHQQAEVLKNANSLIITSTTLANNTYSDILSQLKPECKTYFLGPSTPLTKLMFELPSVAGIFGSRFDRFDTQVLNVIENGGGTRTFLNRMQKVYILK